ncbi:MAG: metallophosphoesterase, partial [Bacteroidales bacterium]|nr:metallophosphoesterase [Bacteroidales bacterium]
MKLSLMIFAGVLALAACTPSSKPDTPSTPEIKLIEPYKTFVSRMSTDPEADHFIYFADQHTECNKDYSTHGVINDILTYIPTDKVVFGGDYVMTTSQCQTKDHVDQSIERFKECVTATNNHKSHFFAVRGNHEITTGSTSTSVKGWTYGQKFVYKQIMDFSKGAEYVEMGNGTCNYYFEKASAKIRYIVLDPYSSDDFNPEVRYGIAMQHNADCQAWLKSSIESMPEGWHAVVFVHQGLNKISISDYGNLKEVRAYINAHADKVKMVVTGHCHKDGETFENGVLHVQVTSANPWQALGDFFGPKSRTYGDYSETAVDLFDLDFKNGIVKAFRFGGGYSRNYHIDPIKIKAGETATLSPITQYTGKWLIYAAESLPAESWTTRATAATSPTTYAP